jgi:hypothetical protein
MRVTLQFTGLFCVRQIDTNRPRCGDGAVQDLPFPAEYDGDSKTDVAVYRDGTWFIIRSSDGAGASVGWGGLAQDVPLN